MQDKQSFDERKRGGKVLWGVLLIGVGAWILLHNLHMTPSIDINVLWPWGLVVIGLMMGFKTRFSTIAPFIVIAIGLFHAVPEFIVPIGNRNISSSSFAVPIVIIVFGIFLILRPKQNGRCNYTRNFASTTNGALEIDVVFGGRKEIITAKDFEGGRITATFGGAELNLMQAESPSKNIVLDVRATFGGCEIIIPSHWEIRNEITPIFGSVEDERILRTKDNNEDKTTLILKGSCVFGGVEIKSF